MSDWLGCPECETLASFTLMSVSGWQEKAVFEERDGDPILTQAGAVHVEDHEPGELCCANCEAVVGVDDLVPIDEDEADR